MITSVIIFLALAATGLSVVLGVRWRKEKIMLMKEIIKSKQNISMGFMSSLFALYIFLSSPEFGFNFRLIIALLLMIVGVFNVVQGIRMHRHYAKQMPSQA